MTLPLSRLTLILILFHGFDTTDWIELAKFYMSTAEKSNDFLIDTDALK